LGPRIARVDGIGRERFRRGKAGVDAGGERLSEREQIPDLVSVAEVDLVADQQCLPRLLGSLLGVESSGVIRGHFGGGE
jgi:hypothetical protein